MDLINPKTMPGVMELLPRDQVLFERMLGTIRETYARFGFLPIETPVMEYKDILLTKSGGDTERQVYYLQSKGAHDQGREIDLCLRFDLTVPLARYVAEHEKQLIFPFRRYQIQRVYRGESAQRGRYREFYQCDIDVIGKDRLPLAYDAEIPAVIHEVFRKLDFGPFTIHINNRKMLNGFFAHLGLDDAELRAGVLRELDKIDKVGREKVAAVLCGDPFSLPAEKVDRILGLTQLEGSNEEKLAALEAMPIEEPVFREGVAALRTVIEALRPAGVPDERVCLNPSIARGLDYYTGTVYETILDDYPNIGSVCSGGRYDNLSGHYTKSSLPGVGISIGATRLFYQLQAAGLLKDTGSSVAVLVTRMDETLNADYLALATQLRASGLNTEIYFGGGKFGKQMKYADRAGIRFAVIMGASEKERGVVTLKDLEASEQVEVARDGLVAEIGRRRV